MTNRKTTANSRLPQWGLTWLNQVQCIYQHLCLVDSEVLRNPPLRQAAKRYKQAEKKDTDTMTMKFLLHKDKEENGKPSPQKQECGCPSLQPSLRSHTHAFLADPPADCEGFAILIDN